MNDRLDRELARLRDDLHAEAHHVAATEEVLADVKAGVATVTELPRRRPLWLAGALVAASAAAIAGIVVLGRDDRAAITVPATDPSVASTLPETTAVPDTTVVPETTVAPTTTVAAHTLVPVQPQSVASIRSISFDVATGGWAIVELSDGTPALIRTTRPGVVPDWVIADAPASATGLSTVTFADAQNGWLTSAQRWWSTHDGGATWNELPVSDSGDAPLEVAIAGGWAMILRYETAADGNFAARVWRSPIDRDDFRATDAVHPKGAGGNEVSLSAGFDGTDVLLSFNDRGGDTMRLHPDGSATPLETPATGRGGDVVLMSAPSGGAVWAYSQTGIWGGDATFQTVVAVSPAAGEPFTEVSLPEPVDLGEADGPRLCGLSQFDDGSTVIVMCDAGGARQYRSTDLGQVWEQRSSMGVPAGEQLTFGQIPNPGEAMVLAYSQTDTAGATTEQWLVIFSSAEASMYLLG